MSHTSSTSSTSSNVTTPTSDRDLLGTQQLVKAMGEHFSQELAKRDTRFAEIESYQDDLVSKMMATKTQLLSRIDALEEKNEEA